MLRKHCYKRKSLKGVKTIEIFWEYSACLHAISWEVQAGHISMSGMKQVKGTPIYQLAYTKTTISHVIY